MRTESPPVVENPQLAMRKGTPPVHEQGIRSKPTSITAKSTRNCSRQKDELANSHTVDPSSRDNRRTSKLANGEFELHERKGGRGVIESVARGQARPRVQSSIRRGEEPVQIGPTAAHRHQAQVANFAESPYTAHE
ncbi:unnamed protein product [Calypogeia fissa]